MNGCPRKDGPPRERRPVPWPDHLFGASAPERAALEGPVGGRRVLEPRQWQAEADITDRSVLRRAEGAVIDIGCGPGRLVTALARNGHVVLGVDESPGAVAAARRRGAPVLLASVFDEIPSTGRWGTALLVDGNIGIGGDPVGLLGRVRELVSPAGRILVEVDPPSASSFSGPVRLVTERWTGPWFPWSTVAAGDLPTITARAGLALSALWDQGGRWFADARRIEPACSDVA